MKKYAKILLATVMCLVICLAATMFVACNGGGKSKKNGDSTGQVSDEQWQQALSFNIDSCENATLYVDMAPTYSKDQAEEYGEYLTMSSKVMVVENAIHFTSTTKTYEQAEVGGKGEWHTSKVNTYYVEYNGKYYNCSVTTDDDNDIYITVNEETKADFIRQRAMWLQSASAFNSFSQPTIKMAFKYNASTQSYEMSQMGYKIELKFLQNGIQDITTNEAMLSRQTITVVDVGTTTFSVPQRVYDAIGEYILTHPSSNS